MKTTMTLAILAVILLTATAVNHKSSIRMMMRKGGKGKGGKGPMA